VSQDTSTVLSNQLKSGLLTHMPKRKRPQPWGLLIVVLIVLVLVLRN
jgi:hypothetical protein